MASSTTNHSVVGEVPGDESKESSKLNTTAPIAGKSNRYCPKNLRLRVKREASKESTRHPSSLRGAESTHRQWTTTSFNSPKGDRDGDKEGDKSGEPQLQKINQGRRITCDITVSQRKSRRSKYEKNHDEVMENI